MKKFLLLALSALFFYNVNAQLDPGYKAIDFTVTDMNTNQTVNLYSWLDSGKYVFVDVFATWCGPCWSFHNSHVLKDLYLNYGPGTSSDDVRVVAIDADPNTTDAQMLGGSGSQGDWVTGTVYPIANPPSAQATQFNNDYDIAYFPTIYMICPDRTIKEVGQLTTYSAYYAHVSPTPQCPAKINEDATPSSLSGDFISCTGSYNLDVTLKNKGFNDLTSCGIEVTNGTTSFASVNWNGLLTTYQTAVQNVNVTGVPYGKNVVVIKTNKAGDQNPNNDSITVALGNYNSSAGNAIPYTTDFESASDMGGTNLVHKDVTSMGLFGFHDGVNSTTHLTGINGSYTKGVFVNFYNRPSGTTGTIVIDNINTTTSDNYLFFDFDVAYCQYQAENDKIEIVYSTDCGATWTSIWSKSGSTLATQAATTSSFIPNSAGQWRHESVDISALKNNPSVLLAFKATSDYGNYGWLDNLNIWSANASSANDFVKNNLVNIYPNPAQDILNVELELLESSNVEIKLLDLNGKVVISENMENARNINQQIPVSHLSNGIYNLQIISKDGIINRKVSIQ